MCLYSLITPEPKEIKPRNKVRTGYVVMQKINRKYYGVVYNTDYNYKLRQWYTADIKKKGKYKRIITAAGGETYVPGFHIFPYLEEAIKYKSHSTEVVVKVRYKGVLAYGIHELYPHDYGNVVVAKQRKLLGQVV